MAGMHLGFALKMGAGFAGYVEKVTLQDDGTVMTPQGDLVNLSIVSGITDKTTDAAHSITEAVTEPFLVLEGEENGITDGFTP